MQDGRIRLHLDHPLCPGQRVPLDADQAHYLFAVMRLGAGAGLLVFNAQDGEHAAQVAETGRRGGALICGAQTRPPLPPPDLWLLFAPLKKARTDFVVEKATELGCARILPVQTDHTNAERIRQDRLQAHAREAAEQCGATHIPQVADLAPLDRVLAGWPADRRILWADESRAGAPAVLGAAGRGAPWAVLIGPEGGFSDRERARLAAHTAVVPVSLGPRILRAETAALAALVLWQAHLGDWT